MIEDRLDDWTNTLSALGSIKDKSTGVEFTRRRRLTRTQRDALYEQNSLVARICDRIADDAFRAGYEITGLDVDVPDLRSRLDDWGIDQALLRGLKWSRKDGGSAILIPTLDDPTTDPSQPLGTPKVVLPPVVYSSDDARPAEYDAAFGSPTFRKVLTYDLGGTLTRQIRVHRSRLLTFEAIDLPPETILQHHTKGWGPSIIDRVFGEISRYGAMLNHASALMYVASILYVKLPNLAADYKSKGGPERIAAMLEKMRASLDALGILGLDGKDEIGAITRAGTGMHELIDRGRSSVAEVADMPREILFNESPAGLNAGELSGPQEIWFSKVMATQENEITPRLNRALEIWFQANGIPATTWTIKWNPLWTRSESSTAQIQKLNADTDAINIQAGILSPDEIRRHRFVKQSQGPIEVTGAAEGQPLDLSSPDVPADVVQSSVTPAEEALNGAQISSLLTIVEKVQAGLIPRDAAIEIVRTSFPAHAARAELMLGSAGVVRVQAPEVDREPPPSDDPVPEDLMSPRDAAAKFGLPTRTITRQIELGTLRYWGLGAHKRVSMAEIATLARAHEAPEEESVDDQGR